MKLSIDTIRQITLGAVEISETKEGIAFYRFTKEQRDLYEKRDAGFFKKSFSLSDIKFSFRTDSKSLGLKGVSTPGSSRQYFSIDLFVDGEKKECFDNFSHITDQPETTGEYPNGEFEKEFDLGEGEKEVLLYLPWSSRLTLSDISLDDGAFVIPVKPEKKMLCFGDSITQGYDASYTSNSYIARLARYLGVEEFNKAIGGEIFCPELAATKESFTPDLITVAYGTNDWSKTKSPEEFKANCKGFYENLAKNYPDTPIYAITPIWRQSYLAEKPCGAFTNVHDFIVEVSKSIPNMTVICGWDFVPADSKYFADKAADPAIIVNIGSMAARNANGNAPLYCTAKAAVNMLSKALLLQVGSKKIRVTTVNPGGADTAFWGERKVDRTKLMNAEDVCDVIMFVLTSNPNIQIHEISFESMAKF